MFSLTESDGEILCLMKTNWNLYEFVSGLIQALSLDVKFGGYGGYGGYGFYRDDCRKEIKVGIWVVRFIVSVSRSNADYFTLWSYFVFFYNCIR